MISWFVRTAPIRPRQVAPFDVGEYLIASPAKSLRSPGHAVQQRGPRLTHAARCAAAMVQVADDHWSQF